MHGTRRLAAEQGHRLEMTKCVKIVPWRPAEQDHFRAEPAVGLEGRGASLEVWSGAGIMRGHQGVYTEYRARGCGVHGEFVFSI